MTAYEELTTNAPTRWMPARLLVLLVAGGWLLLAGPLPTSLHGTGLLVVLALTTVDILLGITTGWLAFRPTSRLDERQALLRDHAYRIAYRLIAVGILVMFGLVIVGGILGGPHDGLAQFAAQLPDGFSGRTIAALLELLVIVPTAAIAWLQPADAGRATTAISRWLPLAAIPVLALAWLLVISFGPVQLLTKVGSNGSFSEANATCEHYAAQERVGFEFGAAIRVGAEVCWNGQEAFVIGDPSLTPQGANLPPEAAATPHLQDLFSCEPYPPDMDFATASQRCVEQIDGDGTMTLTAAGPVTPMPNGIGERQLEIQLIVDRNGKVLRFE